STASKTLRLGRDPASALGPTSKLSSENAGDEAFVTSLLLLSPLVGSRSALSDGASMFKASWMAESATSVGSLTFLGVFAMFSPSPRYTLYAYVRLRPRDCPRKPPEIVTQRCARPPEGRSVPAQVPANILL